MQFDNILLYLNILYNKNHSTMALNLFHQHHPHGVSPTTIISKYVNKSWHPNNQVQVCFWDIQTICPYLPEWMYISRSMFKGTLHLFCTIRLVSINLIFNIGWQQILSSPIRVCPQGIESVPPTSFSRNSGVSQDIWSPVKHVLSGTPPVKTAVICIILSLVLGRKTEHGHNRVDKMLFRGPLEL